MRGPDRRALGTTRIRPRDVVEPGRMAQTTRCGVPPQESVIPAPSRCRYSENFRRSDTAGSFSRRSQYARSIPVRVQRANARLRTAAERPRSWSREEKCNSRRRLAPMDRGMASPQRGKRRAGTRPEFVKRCEGQGSEHPSPTPGREPRAGWTLPSRALTVLPAPAGLAELASPDLASSPRTRP